MYYRWILWFCVELLMNDGVILIDCNLIEIFVLNVRWQRGSICKFSELYDSVRCWKTNDLQILPLRVKCDNFDHDFYSFDPKFNEKSLRAENGVFALRECNII